ncbi:tannase/feruloyl esterase family alpha/beta hydrolase [bacterium M00.F.Ca.ET.228.01.1.1]|uniref:tannase/feruloyl esterase family alpha/beta hydrolase n=1 Tax=Paraburkholderia phenoliruptrix TaxID=252970 RepID=UPI0010924759|nr:tannase/feruloyl esterase family alpha/beta hydrolase [Paraburkholderia phenoliruptrix]TGP42136.1 tannase/feruloyl esterase family alpha/beta hydrolase [bacterium M00.F.Ca.ET.228.01.1.1]TGR99567.1 tannase/feruloyl esterase family alpha/beta hydrolase [bacterium M00.F.Ca.ET.191.01.1.1]TGU03934.1 tannase/feruloyl esterase family alpha/beta hydrolase [bacterium M00.F.Ca.ET.155.01.1.1]MBW0448307.1 tannase/feruloyl esterase family alpha/beta hydrolase [Paraburkholderia phenoliruptrix]MBW9099518.
MNNRPLWWALALSFCISGCGGNTSGGGSSTSSTPAPTAATQCASLNGLSIPASSIGAPTSGATITSATLTETSGEYCKVNGAIAPVDPAAPSINFQVNLPTNWNRKALHYGGGGFDGTLITGVEPLDMAPAGSATPLANGYATFGDDSGHQSSSITDGKFAANDEALANYGGLSLKKTHDVAMALIRKRYSSAPDKVYFFGSSTGGRDGLSEAQRWPSDYDGIVVNRPALNYTGLRLSNVVLGRALYLNNGAGWLDVAKTVRLQNAVMSTCDALDGVADGIVSNVAACKAQSPTVLASVRCANGADTGDTCLSDAQIATVQTIAAPLQLSYPLANGVTRYAGYNILAGSVFAGPYTTRDLGESKVPANPAGKKDANQWVTGDQWVKYFVTRVPTFNSLTFDPLNPAVYESRVQAVSALTDATSTDLSAYVAKGGKLIMTHGLADEIVSTDSSTDYYNGLVQRFGQNTVDGFVRFYLMPGVGHGTGPFHPAIDSLSALDQWVESGKAPETLTMSDLNAATLGRTRPLCRYPSWPKYVGGDVNAAASYQCVNQ